MKRRITAKGQYTTYASYPLVAGDVRAYEICLDLGKDVPGAEFKVTAFRADGKVIEDIGVVENGVALYTMASNMYAIKGELTVRLAVLHDMSVLTDREIIFEVLEGVTDTGDGKTVVPINDSIILRLANLEQKLSEKVDRESGKGLSANDFTAEYKEKLDGIDKKMAGEIEKVMEETDNLSDSLDGHKESTDNPHSVTAKQVGAYDKEQTDQKLSGKVDKEAGKGLSTNDFTDEYKEKLDGLDEIQALEEHKENTNNPHNVSASQVGAYSKEEVDEKLDKKVGKYDITNVYKFRGSVEKYDNLPVELTFEVGGVPKDETGAEIGSYDAATGKFTFDYSITPTEDDEKRITIPLKTSVHLPEGFYACGYIDFGEISLSVGDGLNVDKYIGEIFCHPVPKNLNETEVSEIVIEFWASDETKDCTFSLKGSGKITAGIWKVEPSTSPFEPFEPVGAGDVYNVLDTDINYAWTGKKWDALGGEHKDMEARAQIGKVDEALDAIIEIQNTLTGGEV